MKNKAIKLRPHPKENRWCLTYKTCPMTYVTRLSHIRGDFSSSNLYLLPQYSFFTDHDIAKWSTPPYHHLHNPGSQFGSFTNIQLIVDFVSKNQGISLFNAQGHVSFLYENSKWALSRYFSSLTKVTFFSTDYSALSKYAPASFLLFIFGLTILSMFSVLELFYFVDAFQDEMMSCNDCSKFQTSVRSKARSILKNLEHQLDLSHYEHMMRYYKNGVKKVIRKGTVVAKKFHQLRQVFLVHSVFSSRM